jgi:hypothetical protein
MDILDKIFFTSLIVLVVCLFIEQVGIKTNRVIALCGLSSIAIMVICILLKIWM